MALVDLELWDGRNDVCHGYRDGLPWWRWHRAPSGLHTPRQLHAKGRRLRPGQDPFGLIVCRRGRRVGQLYRLDLTLPAHEMTDAKWASVAAMERGARTCPGCRQLRTYRIPRSTRRCWPCMQATGDYGQPPSAV